MLGVIKLSARAAFAVGIAIVIWASLASHEDLPLTVNVWDKLQHTLAYGALAIAGIVGFPDRRGLLGVGIGLVALGAGLEVVQALTPSRKAGLDDGLANVIGVTLGLAIGWLAARLVGLRQDGGGGSRAS